MPTWSEAQIIAVDDEGYVYAFEAEADFLRWLEPLIVETLRGISRGDGQMLVLEAVKEHWAVREAEQRERLPVKSLIQAHEARWGRVGIVPKQRASRGRRY